MVVHRLLALALGSLALLSSCVVVEQEGEVRTPEDGAPTQAPGTHRDLPQASPAPLEPRSDRRLVGSLGWALLSGEVPRAVVEVDQLGGATLSSEAIGAIREALRTHGRKESVEVDVTDAPLDRDSFSLEGLVSVAGEHRDHHSGDDTVAVHVLVLPGSLEEGGVPGAAFGATTFAVFPDQLRGPLPQGAEVESFEAAVVVHELGHTFGLVNRTGAAPEREDADHPGHTADEESVMYWAVESPTFAEVFQTGPPGDFTDDDRREMDRIRARTP